MLNLMCTLYSTLFCQSSADKDKQEKCYFFHLLIQQQGTCYFWMQWWNVTKYIYSSTKFKYNLEVFSNTFKSETYVYSHFLLSDYGVL